MSERPAKRVLLVVWEGADWRMIHPLLDAGRMPHLAAIVESGVMGELATLQPQLAPLLWASLATGKRADKHGALGYLEPIDGRVRSATSESRGARPLWGLLNEAHLRTHVVGWPDYPAENVDGVFVSQHFVRHGTDAARPRFARLPRAVHPQSLAATLAELRVGPRELGPAELLPFVPRAAEVDQARDPGLAIIATWLAEWSATHAIATWAIEHEPWDFALVSYDAIDRFGHAFMQFHPPRMHDVNARGYEQYQGVMNAVYQYSDAMLGRLVQLAGPETTVIVMSDHGFRSGRDRPATQGKGRSEVAWHRQLGILAMRGPAVRRDEWIWTGSLLDICPTVLALLGLPVGEDMDGRPLVQVFAQPVVPQYVATWEPAAAAAPSQSERLPADSDEQAALCEHLVDEGFLEAEQIDGPLAAEQAIDARDFNLAQVHLERGQVARAAEILQAIVDRRPGVPRFALQLAQCRASLGDVAECRRLVELALQCGVPAWHGRRILAQLLTAEQDYEGALAELFAAEQVKPRQSGIHCQIGEVYAAMQRFDDAARAFDKELQLDPDHALAHFGQGQVALAHGEYERAADELLISISLWHAQPKAHFALGQALEKLGQDADAIRAYERCVALAPNGREAQRRLAELREKADENERALEHPTERDHPGPSP